MTNANSTVRALITYALVLPSALLIGYLLANQRGAMDMATWGFIFLVLLVMCAPLILRWHHQALFLVWNMTAVVFFLPGQPQIWMLVALGSLLTSVTQRALAREMHFVSAPSLLAPLLFFGLVVVVTAKFTGGFGLASMGGSSAGAKRYYWMLFAVLGYVAMTARPISREHVWVYVGLYFFGSFANVIGGFLPWVPQKLWFIYYLFPVETTGLGAFFDAPNSIAGMFRFHGLSMAAMGVFFYLLARHGIKGLLQWGKTRYFALLVAMLAICTMGGYRSFFVLMGTTFIAIFILEGCLRTRYTLVLVIGLVVGGGILALTARHLPLPMQRTLSFLPIDVDPTARFDAQISTDWRLEVWRRAWPEVADHLWFGKGYGISATDLALMEDPRRRFERSPYESALITQDYHSGPLSLLIPFGIWGAIAWLWLVLAGTRALYLNRKYGDESLRNLNTFLLGYFIARSFHYLGVFGAIQVDLAAFVAPLAMSVCVNGGVLRKAADPVTEKTGDLDLQGGTATTPFPVPARA